MAAMSKHIADERPKVIFASIRCHPRSFLEAMRALMLAARPSGGTINKIRLKTAKNRPINGLASFGLEGVA